MSDQVVLFPDAAKVVIDYLADEFDDRDETAVVVGAVPNPRPNKFVRVMRTGGPRINPVVDRPLITVEAWADDPDVAGQLARLSRGLIHAMRGTVQGGVTCYRIDEAAGPADLPDPDSAQSRVTFLVAIGMRGTPE